MAGLIHTLVSNYNEIEESSKDASVASWPLMGSPGPVLCIVGVYLMFVLKVGPKMMEKRPAYQLNSTLIAYNAFQVLFSLWLLLKLVDMNIIRAIVSPKCDVDSKSTDPATQSSLTRNGWWYFTAKIMELLDTVFFVLRKKQNQISFLHVYHHSMTATLSWFYVRFMPSEQGAIVGLLNTFVHVVMYTYYLLAAMGPQYKKYLWWKKYLTVIQLVQFLIVLTYLCMLLAMDCKVSKSLTYFFITNMVIFLYLFGNFYRKTYNKKTV
ncbi:elongation of very long chain fatty acid james bond protein [Nomia melanderi]|uniref:elongation of very long chain fatty acid james bond protein n=1 Tax=Nomia melanderi TaxID=2448451 RepID=UPI0013045CAE|nr:elongation of very long chain fatty acids protein AAEL008004 [Nomia melanderi]